MPLSSAYSSRRNKLSRTQLDLLLVVTEYHDPADVRREFFSEFPEVNLADFNGAWLSLEERKFVSVQTTATGETRWTITRDGMRELDKATGMPDLEPRAPHRETKPKATPPQEASGVRNPPVRTGPIRLDPADSADSSRLQRPPEASSTPAKRPRAAKKPCSFPDCNRPVHARDLCQAHYKQKWLKGQELRPVGGPPNRRRKRPVRTSGNRKPPEATCSFPDCGRPRKSRDLCQTHNRQRLKGQELRPIRPIGPPHMKRECSFDGCTRVARTSDLCKRHYEQKRQGKPLTPIRPIRPRSPAKVPVAAGSDRKQPESAKPTAQQEAPATAPSTAPIPPPDSPPEAAGSDRKEPVAAGTETPPAQEQEQSQEQSPAAESAPVAPPPEPSSAPAKDREDAAIESFPPFPPPLPLAPIPPALDPPPPLKRGPGRPRKSKCAVKFNLDLPAELHAEIVALKNRVLGRDEGLQAIIRSLLRRGLRHAEDPLDAD